MVFSFAISIWYGTIIAPIPEPGNRVGKRVTKLQKVFENHADLPGPGS
jgi:hypothetical protein